jgi:hypothetical protein
MHRLKVTCNIYRTPDGRGLFACSHDGTVVCILLNKELLEEVPEEQVVIF